MKIKFVNLNIWYGGDLFHEAVKFLQAENSDVIALQEVTGKNFADLKNFLGYKYYCWKPSLIHITENGEVPIGNAVFSKFLIVSHEATFYERPLSKVILFNPKTNHLIPRNLLHATLNVEGSIINVFTTQGIWGKDDKDNPQRMKMAEIVASKVHALPNIILSGDFNVDQNTQAIAQIEKELKNVFKNELKSSFNLKWKTQPGFAKSVVDFIFTSPNIKALEHHMFQVNISDHMPLVANFEL